MIVFTQPQNVAMTMYARGMLSIFHVGGGTTLLAKRGCHTGGQKTLLHPLKQDNRVGYKMLQTLYLQKPVSHSLPVCEGVRVQHRWELRVRMVGRSSRLQRRKASCAMYNYCIFSCSLNPPHRPSTVSSQEG